MSPFTFRGLASMLGMKMAKAPELFVLYTYKRKQKDKVASLAALEREVVNL